MKKIKVNLQENSYNIYLGNNILSNFFKETDYHEIQHNKILLVIDKNILRLHSEKIFDAFGENVDYISIKGGESAKSLHELNNIYNYLTKHNYGKDTTIVAIGGGSIGDVAGFAASTFMRGISLVHIPTTLLSALDSSIGGKTAINLKNTKNVIGTYYQPNYVLVDFDFLPTLNKKDILSGFGEIVKYCFLSHYNYYFYVNNNINEILNLDMEVLPQLISRSAQFKASIVAEDERELSTRKLLNFGHTFGHAFESSLNFKVSHGEAVIAGIVAALYLSNKKKILLDNKLDMYLKFLKKIKISNSFKKIDNESVLDYMTRDKKNRHAKMKFVLLNDIGTIAIDEDATKNEIYYAIDSMKEFFK